MFSFFWSLLFFILALGILIAVHEWGHFIVARRCGVKVLRFNIGFGKALWKTEDKHGTEYVVAAIPLGGYVRMLDERVDEVREEEKAVAFNRQPVGNRIAIIAAGPITNFIFAILALFVMYLIGVDSVKPIIGEVKPNSVAAQANLPSRAEITKVGERETRDWEAVNLELVSHIGGEKVTITTRDEGSVVDRTHVMHLSDWSFNPDEESALSSLGITPFRPPITTTVAYVAENSPASRADLRVDDKIIQLDGTTIEKWEQIVEHIAERPGATIGLMVERAGSELAIMAAVGEHPDLPDRGYLGIVPRSEPWPEQYRFLQQYNPIGALVQAVDKTWRLMSLSVEMIGKLITGDVSVKNLSGPISIAQGAGTSAGYGLVYFLSFLALISVNLGIINLLPLPVLDGGHLLYYFIELFRGKPVPESVQEIGFRIGGAVLLLLMTIAIVNDIARL